MSEDTIKSSPSKFNKSIRDTRLMRKNKRKKENECTQIESDHDQVAVTLLNAFYKDSEDECTENEPKTKNTTFVLGKPSSIISNFKPFEIEKSLALADHILCQQTKLGKKNLPSLTQTQGFIACISLARDEKITNSSFSITESELINCCDQAENNIGLSSNDQHKDELVQQELTPNKNDFITLVNSILQDFSQSPLTKEQMTIKTSWQYTPEFRLRRQPVKTYSRKFLNSKKTNLSQRFEEHEYSDDHSSCSSLSIQEGATVEEQLYNQSSLTNVSNTQHLCDNLLNLTEYFTQNRSHRSSLDVNYLEQQQDLNESLLWCHDTPDLIKDILNLRSMHPNTMNSDSFNSSDDFNGFSSPKNYKNSVIDIDNDEKYYINTTSNITDDLNGCENRLLETSIIQTDKDWHIDECLDIFADINTQNILLHPNNQRCQNQVENVTECSLPTSSNDNNDHPKNVKKNFTSSNSIGFKTASAKPIEVSREAHIKAAGILSELPDIPTFEDNSQPKNCDTKNVKDENIFKNPEDYEWNDDCDLFLNFQTPIPSKEIPTPKIELQTQLLPQQAQNTHSTSKIAIQGFNTAAGKKVLISEKAQKSVQKLLNDFTSDVSHINNIEEELKKFKCKAYEKSHNLETTQTPFSDNIKHVDTNQGYQTAKGKNIVISKKAQENVKHFFNEFCAKSEQNYEKDLESLKQKITNKNYDNKKTTLGSNKTVEDLKINSREDLKNLENFNCMDKNNLGFKTASGNKLIISTKAQKSVEKLVQEFTKNIKEDIFSDLDSIKNDINKKNHKHKQNVQEDSGSSQNKKHFTNIISNSSLTKQTQSNLNNMHKNETKALNTDLNLGFQTAKGNKVSISTKAIKTVESLLNEFNNDLDVEQCEGDIYEMKAQIQIKNKFERETKTMEKETEEKKDSLNITLNIGFQPANGQESIITTDNSNKSLKKLLQEFHTDLDLEKYEIDLSNDNTKMQIKNTEPKPTFDQDNNEYNNMVLSEWPIIFNEDKPKSSTTKVTQRKRKLSIDNGNLEDSNKSTPIKVLKSSLQATKSLFAEQTCKSPLTLKAQPVILRKNLLSLTKRRRSKRNSLSIPNEEIPKIYKEKYDLNENTVTPIKSSITLAASKQTPATPNLQEFFSNAPLTSTPCVNMPSNSYQTIEDTDFKPICWKSSNNSTIYKPTKLSDNSPLNVTFSSSNPTAKERIGRLQMYGEAPAVSPILIETSHNCRPLGLRRSRSMLKKTEK